MATYIIRRSLRMAVILVLASIAVFYALRIAPGDPSGTQLNAAAREEVRAAYRERLGLNEPIWKQYFVYVGNVLHGDFGTSLITGATTLGSVIIARAKPPVKHMPSAPTPLPPHSPCALRARARNQ